MVGSFLSLFVNTHFDNLERIKGVRCPVILIHGSADTLIPSSHSETLFEELMKNVGNEDKES